MNRKPLSTHAAELQARYAAHRKAYREANDLPSGRMSRGELPKIGEVRPS